MRQFDAFLLSMFKARLVPSKTKEKSKFNAKLVCLMKRVIIISAKLRFILWQDIFLSKPSRWAMLEQVK